MSEASSQNLTVVVVAAEAAEAAAKRIAAKRAVAERTGNSYWIEMTAGGTCGTETEARADVSRPVGPTAVTSTQFTAPATGSEIVCDVAAPTDIFAPPQPSRKSAAGQFVPETLTEPKPTFPPCFTYTNLNL